MKHVDGGLGVQYSFNIRVDFICYPCAGVRSLALFRIVAAAVDGCGDAVSPSGRGVG